jgi:hypothetical protein
MLGRLGFARVDGIDCQGRRRALPGLLPELGGDPDRWGPPVSGRGREGKYPFGFCPGMGRGPLLELGQMAPRRPFSISLIISSFSDFCFNFYLFQKSSNQFKPFPIFFCYSILSLKPVIKQVFKIKYAF